MAIPARKPPKREHVVDPDGTERWLLDGELHREDGPARISAEGNRHWYLNGVRHRIGGPAIEMHNGTVAWYEDGRRHREGAPAVVAANGRKQWWHHGKRHREDGPAIDDGSGADEGNWHIDGRPLGAEEIAALKEKFAAAQRKVDAVQIAGEMQEGLRAPVHPLKPPSFGR